MPTNYFEYSQAPIIQVDIPLGIPEVIFKDFNRTLYFGGNHFAHNKNYQVVALGGSVMYYGSLFQLDCGIADFRLEFAYNLV